MFKFILIGVSIVLLFMLCIIQIIVNLIYRILLLVFNKNRD